jgi:hypothetical protein
VSVEEDILALFFVRLGLDRHLLLLVHYLLFSFALMMGLLFTTQTLACLPRSVGSVLSFGAPETCSQGKLVERHASLERNDWVGYFS